MAIQTIVITAGRALLALLFVLAGLAKIAGPKPFLAHMAEFNVPAFFLPAVIALELVAGLSLLVGFRTFYAAGALGLFCLLTAAVFHHEISIPAERTLFVKDLAIAGALILVAGVNWPGAALVR